MTSQVESTAAAVPPPLPPFLRRPPNPLDSWKELRPFRETFLRHFTEPGHREALETVGEMVFTLALEYATYWPVTEEESLVEILRTTALDLRYLQGMLAYTAQESGRNSMDDKRLETWLLAHSAEWADQLSEVASEIEQAVAE